MRYVFAAILAAHGVAHLVGFLVPWQFMSAPDMPYRTTVLAGRFDLGDAGIRAMGVMWLLTGAACVGAAVSLFLATPWATTVTFWVLLASLAMCLVSLPEARIGAWLNVGLIVVLLALPRLWRMAGRSEAPW